MLDGTCTAVLVGSTLNVWTKCLADSSTIHMHAHTFTHAVLLQRILLIGLSTNQWLFTHFIVTISVHLSQCCFPFLSFLVASVHLFILSIRKKQPLFLPPGERRRWPRWEITPAQLYSGHAQACLQDKQRCACKDHNHLTPDRV